MTYSGCSSDNLESRLTSINCQQALSSLSFLLNALSIVMIIMNKIRITLTAAGLICLISFFSYHNNNAVSQEDDLFPIENVDSESDLPDPLAGISDTNSYELTDDRFRTLFSEEGIRTHFGQVQFIKGKQVTLAFERPGLVTDVVPREGLKVLKGDIIAKLNDEAARYTYESAKLEASNDVDIRFADKSMELAETEYQKAVDSNKRIPNTVVDIEVQRLKLAFERGELQLEQAQHQQKVNKLTAQEAGAQLKTFEIKAPFDGTVVKLHKFVGEAVSQGDPIVELVNIDQVRIKGAVSIQDRHKIKIGDRVQVKIHPIFDYPGTERVFEGRLTMIDLELGDSIDSLDVWAEVDNFDNLLLPGLLTVMQIIPGS